MYCPVLFMVLNYRLIYGGKYRCYHGEHWYCVVRQRYFGSRLNYLMRLTNIMLSFHNCCIGYRHCCAGGLSESNHSLICSKFGQKICSSCTIYDIEVRGEEHVTAAVMMGRPSTILRRILFQISCLLLLQQVLDIGAIIIEQRNTFLPLGFGAQPPTPE